MINELGYTTRALFLFNQKHNELGQRVEDGDMLLVDFREWQSETYEPVRKAMVARNLAAKVAVRAGPYPKDGKASDFDGVKITKPNNIKIANIRETYAYALKLESDHKQIELDVVSLERSSSFYACEKDKTFDVEIGASDEFKKL